ncbi:MAG: hypothetical protein ACXQS8_08510, partial [Candidatus Helarchaeales archaeon]
SKDLWVMTRHTDLDFAISLINAAERLKGEVVVITLERHQIPTEEGQKAYDMMDTSMTLRPTTNSNINGTVVIKDDKEVAISTANLVGNELVKSHSIAWIVEDETIVARFKKYLNDLLPSFMRK